MSKYDARYIGPVPDDIVDRLEDLLKEATTERSHYYVAATCRDAIAEIKRLREFEWMYKELQK